jgi:serine protease Do
MLEAEGHECSVTCEWGWGPTSIRREDSMRLLKFVGVLAVLAGVGLYAQARPPFGSGGDPSFMVLAGRGAQIGVSVRDARTDDKAPAGGVVVEEVQPDSAAAKAGLKRSDVIVEFDGEHVRSARQFTRLVQETAPGRTVKATVMRDGQRKDLQITLAEGRAALAPGGDGMVLEGQQLRERLNDLGRLGDRTLPFDFNGGTFSFQMPQADARGRLGVAVDELTPQLATYFGAKDGVLIASVSEDSPASRAGLKAGDVIVKIDNEPVRSREDLVRLLADVKDGGEATIGLVRDKKETTVTVKLEARRPGRRG